MSVTTPPVPTRGSRRAVMAAVAILASWLLPPLLAGQVHFGRDVMFFKAPYLAEFSRILREGRFPWWSERLGGGMPLWHHPAAELADPLSWPAVFMDPLPGWSMVVVLHACVAAAGAVLLARAMRVAPSMAAACGVAYACCGGVASLWTVKLVPSTGLPWLLLALLHLCRHGRGVVPVALSTAYLLLHPDPPMLLAAGVAALAVVAWERARRPFPLDRVFLPAATACVTGLLLAAPFLLPASVVPADAERTAAVEVVRADGSDLSWGVLLETWAPGALGVRGHGGAHGVVEGLAAPRLAPHAALGSPAWLALVLALAAWKVHPGRRRDAWPAVTGAVLLVLGSGAVPGTHAALAAINGRFPQKLWLPASLLLLLAASRVLSALLHRARRTPPMAAWLLPAALSALLVPLAWRVPGAQEGAVNTVLQMVLLAGATGVATAWLAWRAPRTWAGPVLAACWSVQMLLCLSSMNITTRAERLEGASAEYLDVAHRGRALAVLNPANATEPVKPVADPADEGDVTIRVLTAMGMAHAPVLEGAHEVAAVDFSQLQPAAMAAFMTGVLPHLDAEGVLLWARALGADRVLTPLPSGDPPPGPDTTTVIDLGVGGRWLDARWNTPVPRVRVVTSWNAAEDARGVHQALARAPAVPVVQGAAASTAGGEARTEVFELADDAVHVRVESTGGALLVLHRARATAWRARVDGVEVPVVPVNLAQMGVVLPAGAHDVTVRVEVPRARAGLALGLLGVLLASGTWWRGRKRGA